MFKNMDEIVDHVNKIELPKNYKETEDYKNWIRFAESTVNSYPHKEDILLFKKINCKTYIKKSSIENAGYGVFASERINAGDLIEEAPFIVLETTQRKNTDSKLTDYSYAYFHKTNKNDANMLIPFGNFLSYNHSVNPNAYYIQDDNFKLLRMYAYFDIEKDEEITWYYSSGYSARILNMKHEDEKRKDIFLKMNNF